MFPSLPQTAHKIIFPSVQAIFSPPAAKSGKSEKLQDRVIPFLFTVFPEKDTTKQTATTPASGNTKS